VARSPADHIELRCQWRKHAEVEAGATGVIRIHCRDCSRKRDDGVVVIHHFDLATGDYINKRYRDPSGYVDNSAVSAERTEEASAWHTPSD
jgi:hypothetical protein